VIPRRKEERSASWAIESINSAGAGGKNSFCPQSSLPFFFKGEGTRRGGFLLVEGLLLRRAIHLIGRGKKKGRNARIALFSLKGVLEEKKKGTGGF